MNWQRVRSWFPVTRELAYLNHAGVAPISTRVEEALRRYAEEASRYGAFHYDAVYDAEIERTRARVATLLGASLGLWLDRHYAGSHSWTLALLVAGLVLGCWNAWHWVAREQAEMHEEESDDE